MQNRLAFDTETELLEKGNVTPRLVCLQLCRPDKAPQIFTRKIAADIFRSYLIDDSYLMVGHNTAYDVLVMLVEDEGLLPLVLEAYRKGRIRDTQVREQLISIREGRAVEGRGAPLDELTRKYVFHGLDKGADSWRYWFGDLMSVPLEQWPPEATRYAEEDPRSTLLVYDAQQRLSENHPAPKYPDSTVSPDEILQTRAALFLQFQRAWGFRTDGEMVAKLRASLEVEVRRDAEVLLERGFYKPKSSRKALQDLRGPALVQWYHKETHEEQKDKPAGVPPAISKNTKLIKQRVFEACQRQGRDAPVTDGGVKAIEQGATWPELIEYVSIAREVLEETNDEELILLAEAEPNKKLLNTFVPLVEAGTNVPITPHWNVLVRSGRTSCGQEDDPGNWQNPAKKGGIRECVIAREAFPDPLLNDKLVPGIFIKADYSQVELCTLSEVIIHFFGKSTMADAINSGRDLHLELATSFDFLLAPMTYEEAKKKSKDDTDPDYGRIKKQRQLCKAMNFGYPGGLGPNKFITYARQSWGIRDMTFERATEAKEAWLRKWPEMRAYFAKIANDVDSGTPVTQLYSGRIRSNAPFCAAANSYFQGLAADGAKEAMWQILWACYNNPKSPLYGFRPVLFIHDEFVLEGPVHRAAQAAEELSRLMVLAMQKYTPHVKIVAEPALMYRFYKEAETRRDSSGVLIPWEPKKKEQKAA